MTKLNETIVKLIIDDMYELKSLKKSLLKHKILSRDFHNFIHENPLLDDLYTGAQSANAEALVEEAIEIADNEENPQKARNQIDIRKWYASKVKPQKFGDRIDLNVNTTVDLKGALTDARSRVKEVIDITPKLVTTATGQVPVAESKGEPQTFEELLGINGDSEK